ncbi:substrate-binding periplasmic protein [Chitinimonas sp. PSY-7]|uniref:transporter substrate-binding domain-containing protein n=1 Tax=Chitinimonas sp. PSY-7 TaxID=3459088 RepID=UPI00403FE638
MYRLLLFITLCLGVVVHAETLEAGFFKISPWAFVGDDGKAKGVLVDFFDQEVAPRAGVQFVWNQPVTPPRLVENLRTGTLHFAPILNREGEERIRSIRFGQNEVVSFHPSLVVNANSVLKNVDRPQDLAGMTVAWVLGANYTDFLEHPDIRVDRTGVPDWEEINLGKLRLGRADAALFSNPYTPRYVAGNNINQFRLLMLPVPPIKLFSVFSPKLDPAVVARVDKAIGAAVANGRLTYYLAKYVSVR